MEAKKSSFYGDVDASNVKLEEVECVGTEKSIFDCQKECNEPCDNDEGAGAVCAYGNHCFLLLIYGPED